MITNHIASIDHDDSIDHRDLINDCHQLLCLSQSISDPNQSEQVSG